MVIHILNIVFNLNSMSLPLYTLVRVPHACPRWAIACSIHPHLIATAAQAARASFKDKTAISSVKKKIFIRGGPKKKGGCHLKQRIKSRWPNTNMTARHVAAFTVAL